MYRNLCRIIVYNHTLLPDKENVRIVLLKKGGMSYKEKKSLRVKKIYIDGRSVMIKILFL